MSTDKTYVDEPVNIRKEWPLVELVELPLGWLDLSNAEREIAGWLLAGLSVKAIAEERFVGAGSVRSQIKSILKKAREAGYTVNSQIQFIALASAHLRALQAEDAASVVKLAKMMNQEISRLRAGLNPNEVLADELAKIFG